MCKSKGNIAEGVVIAVAIAIIIVGAVLFTIRPYHPGFSTVSACYSAVGLSANCNRSMSIGSCCDKYSSYYYYSYYSSYYYCTQYYGKTDSYCVEMFSGDAAFTIYNSVGMPLLVVGCISCFISGCMLCCSRYHVSQWKKRKDLTDQFVQKMNRSNNHCHVAFTQSYTRH